MQMAEDQRKHILIVEDEGLIAADIQNRLERLGYSVPVIARCGEDAIRCARSMPFDLALMDIRLNGEMDGIDTAQVLRTKFEVPVVYITAHADEETIDRAKLTEPFGYLVKPVGDGELRSTVLISLYKHEMERRVRMSEAWLATTLGSVGEGILATDAEGTVVFLNPAAEQLTGWSSPEADGRPLIDVLRLLVESTGVPAKNPLLDLFAGEYRAYRLLARTGVESIVEIGWFENRSGRDLLGGILVVRDIGARREMEKQLIQAQRMEAIANMAGALAHDFNNQLTIVLGYAMELSRKLSGKEREQALEIQHAASIGSSITSQLLTLSRRDAAHFEILNLNDIIGEMQPLISRSLGHGRTLVTDLGSPLGLVRADRNQVKQVLVNLALNARDAMSERGVLRMETSTIEIESDSPPARIYRPGAYMCLRVEDPGEGMDEGTLSRIFEPFFTTKKPGFGTGLGLSIVHSIVTRSGGYISVRSHLGQGTSFVILLPCVGGFQGATGLRGAEIGSDSGDPSATVLLVDDEDAVRRLMRCYLERAGYHVLEASTGEEAEVFAKTSPDRIDVLVADVAMPGITGPETARRLALIRPTIKVLFVSGYQHDLLDNSAIPVSGANLLSKPFVASELIGRVRMLLGKQTVCCDPGERQAALTGNADADDQAA